MRSSGLRFVIVMGLLSLFSLGDDEPAPIISLNLCTDQILLALRPDTRLFTSPLSMQTQYNYLHEEVDAKRLSKKKLENLILLNPSIVITGIFTDPYLLKGLKLATIPLLSVPYANSLHQAIDNILLVSTAIHEEHKGKALASAIQQKRQRLSQQTHAKKKTALFYAPGGFTHGKHTIYDELLALAGLENLANTLGIEGHGYMTLETLVLNQPDYLIIEDNQPNQATKAQQLLHHPVFKHPLFKSEIISLNTGYLSCAGMGTLLAVEQLLEQINR